MQLSIGYCRFNDTFVGIISINFNFMATKNSIYGIGLFSLTLLFSSCSEEKSNTPPAKDKYADAAEKVCACGIHLTEIEKMNKDLAMLQDDSLMVTMLDKQAELENCIEAAYGADKDSVKTRVVKLCPALADY
jgi:hypothetical protein